jgi:hypothetical protein
MPWLLALGALALIAAAAGTAKASPKGMEYVAQLKRTSGKALVNFTLQKVFWKTVQKRDKKTGKIVSSVDLYRTEVVEEPASLAVAASARLGKTIGLNTFVLATLIASEAGRGHPLAKAAIGWATKNQAAKKGQTIFKLVAPNGKLGSQQGRYAASKTPPTAQDVEIASAVLEGRIKDPTGGALQWDSPRAQKTLKARGEPGYGKGPEEVAMSRQAEGRRLVTWPGIDPNYLRLWA